MTPQLLKEVEQVALRRMAAMVSPAQVLPDSQELVTLGMGQLFALITDCMQVCPSTSYGLCWIHGIPDAREVAGETQ